MTFKKRITAVLLALTISLQSIQVFADEAVGDPNIDNGGGGLGAGTHENGWYPLDDGVRITLVDAESGEIKSVSIDYTNKHPDDIQIHFGKVPKTSYLNGTSLTPTNSPYTYKVPTEPLPVIVSDGSNYFPSIDSIRSYFTDEQIVKAIAADLGIDFEEMINGDYKLMVEPLVYVTYNGVRTALTATEAALYNLATGGDFINKFAPLSHKNLPLAMFLEEDDLGYTAWNGSTTTRASDSDIINNLGVGIITFKEKEEEVEVETFDYEYRVDTDVYTSVTVSGGRHTPDNPITVTFRIKGTNYTVSNVVYPEGASQLVWCRWHTPNTEQQVTIYVTVEGGAEVSKSTIVANIVDLDENPPPDPTAYDRNDSFTTPSVPSKAQRTTATWSRWYCYWVPKWVWIPVWTRYSKVVNGKTVYYWRDNGYWKDKGDWAFATNTYSASIRGKMDIKPDGKNPTYVGSTMKSGYGINETVTSNVYSSGECTEIQNAVTYFPEFSYKKYWRLLEYTGSQFEFKNNEYSTYNNRTHFTPVWYPDGNYTAYTWVLDCWTPAGMLSLNLTDSVNIDGNVYDDWHIAPTH